jgi:hypothetical protein
MSPKRQFTFLFFALVSLCICCAPPVYAQQVYGLESYDHEKPTLLVYLRPLSFLVHNYNLGFQFPISSRVTVGPRATFFEKGFCWMTECQGSVVGIRFQYFSKRDWNQPGPTWKAGVYRNNWEAYNRDGGGPVPNFGIDSLDARGWMIEGLFSYQWALHSNQVLIDLGGGLEVLETKYWNSSSDPYSVFPVLEANIGIFL